MTNTSATQLESSAAIAGTNGQSQADPADAYQRKLRSTAYHEAGHMVACLALGGDPMSFTLASRQPGREFNGHVAMRGLRSDTPRDLRMHMVVLAAGVEGERLIDQSRLRPAGYDLGTLIELAKKIHGIAADRRIRRAEIDRAQLAARELLAQHRSEVDRIASMMLMNHDILASVGELDDDEITGLIEGSSMSTATSKHDPFEEEFERQQRERDQEALDDMDIEIEDDELYSND